MIGWWRKWLPNHPILALVYCSCFCATLVLLISLQWLVWFQVSSRWRKCTAYTVFAFFQYCITKSQDSGFHCNARKRQWHIAVRAEWGRFVREPQEVYDKLMKSTKDLQVCVPDVFWLTDPVALNQEKKYVKKRCKVSDSLSCPQLRSFLFEKVGQYRKLRYFTVDLCEQRTLLYSIACAKSGPHCTVENFFDWAGVDLSHLQSVPSRMSLACAAKLRAPHQNWEEQPGWLWREVREETRPCKPSCLLTDPKSWASLDRISVWIWMLVLCLYWLTVLQCKLSQQMEEVVSLVVCSLVLYVHVLLHIQCHSHQLHVRHQMMPHFP